MKLVEIILSEEKKESLKKTYHTYSCYFVLKVKRGVNRTHIVERIRGIKTVTIVDLRGDDSLDKINKRIVDYEYCSVEVKFITNKPPKEHIEFLKKAMVKSDKAAGIDFIPGIVAAKEKEDTLLQLK